MSIKLWKLLKRVEEVSKATKVDAGKTFDPNARFELLKPDEFLTKTASKFSNEEIST